MTIAIWLRLPPIPRWSFNLLRQSLERAFQIAQVMQGSIVLDWKNVIPAKAGILPFKKY